MIWAMFRLGNVARFFFPRNRFCNLPRQKYLQRLMRIRAFPIALLLCCLTLQSMAQKVTNESRFKAGVEDYKQRRYAQSMEKLLPLTSTTAVYVYSEYAHYYYALSAYHNKKYKESRQMLLQLINKFPGWNRMNDVNYLLGANNLAAGQWKEGLGYLDKIRENSFNKDIQSLKHYYLSRITDLATLVNLQKQYPDDKDIAVEVVQFIGKSPRSTATDQYYAQQLVKQFKLSKDADTKAEERAKYTGNKAESQWTKGYFNVSVLLPFRLEEYLNSKKRSNQFAYDYYQGLLLAKAKLKTEGIDVRLWAYDVSAEAKPMSDIVGEQNFQQSDLVIGPLYQGPFEVAANYVSDMNTYMLNPLSTDGSLIKNASTIYLAHPSIAYQMQKAAQWMKTVAPSGSVAIYYGNSAKDSLMAASYAEEIKSKGGKVLQMVRIQPSREWMEGKISLSETQKPGHVALLCSDSGTGAALLELLNGRKLTSLPVIATSASFNLQQSRLNRYGSRLYLIEADYVDREKEQIRQFQKLYWEQVNSFPTVYSYQGYDQLLFFGRMLFKYKDKLSKGLEMRRYDEDDYLLSGFDYTKSHENQIPSILRFDGTRWEPMK